MPGGRPTKYNKKKLQTAKDYLKECRDGSKFPTVEELSLRLDVDDDTVVRWTKKHPKFHATIKKISQLQRDQLIRRGLSKEYSNSMSIFLLKANHGMIETERRMLVGEEGGSININWKDDKDNND